MSEAINTYGLKPLTWWKLFEVEGWQVLVSVEQSEDDDDRYALTFSTAFEALGDVTSVKVSGSGREWAEQAFEATSDGRKAIQAILDQAGPLIAEMVAGADD